MAAHMQDHTERMRAIKGRLEGGSSGGGGGADGEGGGAASVEEKEQLLEELVEIVENIDYARRDAQACNTPGPICSVVIRAWSWGESPGWRATQRRRLSGQTSSNCGNQPWRLHARIPPGIGCCARQLIGSPCPSEAFWCSSQSSQYGLHCC